MKEWHLECVDRATGADSTQVAITESEAEAFAVANKRGLMVARVLRVNDLLSAPVPNGGPESVATGREWRRGAALVEFGGWFNLVGVVCVPCAMIGCLCGVFAMEASDGQRGKGVAVWGMVLTTVWSVGVALIWASSVLRLLI